MRGRVPHHGRPDLGPIENGNCDDVISKLVRPRMDSDAGHQNLVLQIYRSVWEEYSEWSNKCRTTTLESLAASYPKLDLQTYFEFKETESASEASLAADDDDIHFTVYEFNIDGLTTDEYLISGKSLSVDQDFRPHPPYESCTPISRNLMVGDDPDYLPFIPFADDPKYDFRLDIEEHHYFRWHQPFLDPDCRHYVLIYLLL